MNKPRFTQRQMIDALTKAKGMVSVAARSLDCDPETVRNYVARYPKVAEAIREARELTLDISELALYKAIQEGEGWAIKYMLATQGKNRGYVERQEITGADGQPQKYVIEHVNDWRAPA